MTFFIEIPNVNLYKIRDESQLLLSSSNLVCIVSQLNGVEFYMLILDKFQTPAARNVVVLKVAKMLSDFFPLD